MVRKLSLAIAVALGVSSFGVNALGLGELKSKSALNEYFNAEIELLSLGNEEIEDIRVTLASPEAFRKAGIERPYYLTQLKFKPIRLPDGRGVIRVSSRDPVAEPFLDFLLEVNWPKGRLLREYTVLLDPPVTLARRPAPVSRARAAPAPAPQVAGDLADTAGGEYGPTRPNDTLWGIASRLRPAGVTQEQMMMALFEANPDAFIRRNINNLKVGQILRVPAREQVLAMTPAQARQAFREQVNEWRTSRPAAVAGQPAPAAVGESAPAAAAAEPVQEAELRIATARPAGEGEAGPAESKDPAAVVAELKQELLASEEARQSALEEGRELQSRVKDLEAQLADLQRLVTLQNNQLAQLQAALSETTLAEPEAEPASREGETGETAPATGTEEGAEATAGMVAEQTIETADATAETEETPTEAEGEMAAAGEETAGGDIVTAEATDTTGDGAEMAAADETVVVDEGVTAADGEESIVVAEEEPAAEGPAEASPVAEGGDGEEPVAATPEAEAKPPAAVSAPMVPPPAKQDLFSRLTSDPNLMMGAAAGGGVLLLAVIWAAVSRRRRARDEEFQESILVDTMDESGDETALATDGPVSHPTEETSFLSDFSPSDIDALQEETGEVDPVAEADVYIAYGRYKQAEELITQALEREPERADLMLKLAEVLYATKDEEAFTQLAERASESGMPDKDPGAWEKLVSMGSKIAPSSQLFAAGAIAAATSATQAEQPDAMPAETASAETSDGVGDAFEGLDDLDNLDLGDLGDLTGGDEEGEELGGGLEFDLDLGDTATETKEEEPEQPVAESKEEEPEFDLASLEDTGTLSLDELTSELVEAGDETAVLELSEQEQTELEETVLDFSGEQAEGEQQRDEEVLSLDQVDDLETPAAEQGGDEKVAASDEVISLDELELDENPELDDEFEEEADEVNTKLDLARAYVDMGDSEGARSILDEVVQEGNETQQDEARKLMEALG